MHDFTDFVPQRRFQPTVATAPDGRSVAVVSNDDGQAQLRVLPLDGGAGRALTHDPARTIRDVAWSPDGTKLAIAFDRGGDEQYQLQIIDATGALVTRLTDAADRQHNLAAAPFSADGTTVVFGANDRDPAVQDVVVTDVTEGTRQRIASAPGALAQPIALSPDAERLLVWIMRSNTHSDAAVIDLSADELVLDVLTSHNGEAIHAPLGWLPDGGSFWLRTNAGREFTALARGDLSGRIDLVQAPDNDIDDVALSGDGSTVAWLVNEGGAHVLHVAPVDRPDAVRRITQEAPGVWAAIDLSHDGGTLVGLWSSATSPHDVVSVDLASGATAHVTDSRPPGLAAAGGGIHPALIEYPTHDGRMIPAWWYRPRGDGPFGVVLSVHGGPEAQEQPTYLYSGLYQYLLANGIGVLAPNVRGSTGYGISYQRLIHRDWGGDELGDLEHAVRYLRTVEGVDPDRIAVYGGSFGGFAALSCMSRLPDLFAAGVSLVGVSNLVTFVDSVPPTWRPLMRAWVGDATDDRDLLVERSPITYVDQIVAPLMIVQGANDPRVVKAESDQIVEALRARGVEVRYDVYDDEGHGFTTRANEIQALGDIAGFLIQHVG